MDLLGIAEELDEAIEDVAFLASHYGDFHPANVGDVSQVLSEEVGVQLAFLFEKNASNWYELHHLERLAEIRRDGRVGYRSQGIGSEVYYKLIEQMAGRSFLITRTGAQLPAIQHALSQGESGKLFNIVEVDRAGRRIRIVYGNAEYGSIPSIETHVHILANALTIAEGERNPATVHAHPHHLILLGRHERVRGGFGRFNAALYTQTEGINRNYFDLVGIVPYCESGSAELVLESIDPLKRHRLVLWMNHGFVVRAENFRRCYALLSYGEESARAALDSLQHGALGLPFNKVRDFLNQKGLMEDFLSLKLPSAAEGASE